MGTPKTCQVAGCKRKVSRRVMIRNRWGNVGYVYICATCCNEADTAEPRVIWGVDVWPPMQGGL